MNWRSCPLGTWALVVFALAIPLIQWLGGVYLLGPMRADDGAFAVSTLKQFETELAAGNWIPRWSFSGNMGVGSPIFYFYPPGSYDVAALVHLIMPRSPDAFVLGASAFVGTFLLIVTCTAWVRRYVDWTRALTAGAICALMPYIALINPQRRLAFAEIIAAPLWPLAFLAVDCGEGQIARTALYVALVVAAFSVIHVPSLILCAGLLPVYALFKGGSVGEIVRRLSGVGAGFVLGMGLAAFYLAPAFTLQANLPLQWADVGFTSNLLSITSLSSGIGKLRDVSLLLPVCTALALAFAARKSKLINWPVLVTLCFGALLATPLAQPLWVKLTPLHRVQFPWRLLQPISVLGAVAISLYLPSPGSNTRKAVISAFAGVGLISAIAAYHVSAHGGSAALRTEQAVRWPSSQAPEYFPVQSANDWVTRQRAGQSPAARAAQLQSNCLKADPPAQRDGDSLGVSVSGCKGDVRLPVFAFPGWEARVGARSARLWTDQKTGLLDIQLPDAATRVTLSRTVLPSLRTGFDLSLGFLMIFLCVAVLSLFEPKWALRKA